MFALRKQPQITNGHLLAAIERASCEAERARALGHQANAAIAMLADTLGRLATRVERIDGRLERLEIYLSRIDPDYPISQVELSPDELERTRARLERALNGVSDGRDTGS